MKGGFTRSCLLFVVLCLIRSPLFKADLKMRAFAVRVFVDLKCVTVSYIYFFYIVLPSQFSLVSGDKYGNIITLKATVCFIPLRI